METAKFMDAIWRAISIAKIARSGF